MCFSITGRGDVVLDQFAGSGTTILAAERVGRIGFGVEYEPGYVDVAIKRWQRATKLEATVASAKFEAGQALLPERAPWLADLEAELFVLPRRTARRSM